MDGAHEPQRCRRQKRNSHEYLLRYVLPPPEKARQLTTIISHWTRHVNSLANNAK